MRRSQLSGEEMSLRERPGVNGPPVSMRGGDHRPSFGYAAARRFTKVAVLIKLSAITPSPTQRAMAVGPPVATAPKSVASFEHADPALAPDPPALPSPKPGLAFVHTFATMYSDIGRPSIPSEKLLRALLLQCCTRSAANGC
jgi:hypothetical protein